MLIEKMSSHIEEHSFINMGCNCLRTMLAYGYKRIQAATSKHLVPELIKLCHKLLDPATPEIACLNVGYLLLNIFDKLMPKISTELLMAVVQKVYKSRMPSVVQSLACLFARLYLKNPKDILSLLTETSVDNRISLKIVLDRWLLHQPLFRGAYSKAVTCAALLQLFMTRDPRVESLMVITYNPSHTNVNSGILNIFHMR
jgi:hypothetical protein